MFLRFLILLHKISLSNKTIKATQPLGIVTHACNQSAPVAQARKIKCFTPAWVHSEFQISLGHISQALYRGGKKKKEERRRERNIVKFVKCLPSARTCTSHGHPICFLQSSQLHKTIIITVLQMWQQRILSKPGLSSRKSAVGS